MYTTTRLSGSRRHVPSVRFTPVAEYSCMIMSTPVACACVFILYFVFTMTTTGSFGYGKALAFSEGDAQSPKSLRPDSSDVCGGVRYGGIDIAAAVGVEDKRGKEGG